MVITIITISEKLYIYHILPFREFIEPNILVYQGILISIRIIAIFQVYNMS